MQRISALADVLSRGHVILQVAVAFRWLCSNPTGKDHKRYDQSSIALTAREKLLGKNARKSFLTRFFFQILFPSNPRHEGLVWGSTQFWESKGKPYVLRAVLY